MTHLNRSNPNPGGETRRDFIKKTAAAASFVATTNVLSLPASGQSNAGGIALVLDATDPLVQQPPVEWAVEQLREALRARGFATQSFAQLDQVPTDREIILVGGRGSGLVGQVLESAGAAVPDMPEALGLVRGKAGTRSVLLACGSDVRGLVYSLLELADRATYSEAPLAALGRIERIIEQSANPIRSIARLFTSEVEDKPWFYDKAFWRRYLTMLATQRFNRFNLTLGLGYNAPSNVPDSYFYFPYPFLLAVPGHNVSAGGLPDEERDRNLAMLRWIGEETVARGLHFQLALWTQAYHFIDSPDVNYPIVGLTPETHGAYCRDALTALLKACPAINGVTFRSHSESGIPQGSYDFWPMVFDGVARCGRRVEIDIHSKGIEHKLLGMALQTGMPVNVSPKYWAEHMGLPYHQTEIQEGERFKPVPGKTYSIEQQRSFTRYGYADYLREDRSYGVLYRVWPGTQRFLLWGDPATAAGYGRLAHFCGSVGLELCEPLSFKGRMGSGMAGDRNGYADASLRPAGGDWEKHLITYRLWGRLLYNPNADPDSWSRYFRTEFGPAARDCEAALAGASRVLPLITTAHLPSASNNGYWPEIVSNMPILGNRFAAVSAIDPGLFSSINEFADELVKGPRSGKYSPLEVANWLTALADGADAHLAKAYSLIAAPASPAFQRLAIDVAIQSGTGRFFAQKLRAGLAYALYQRLNDRTMLEQAVNYYRAARDNWKKIVQTATGVYQPDLTYGPERHLRGNWADRLPVIEKDLAAMEKLEPPAAVAMAEGDGRPSGTALLAAALASAAAPAPHPRCEHLPSISFRPGEPVAVEVAIEAGFNVTRARLHYRHVNQGEEHHVVDMAAQGNRYQHAIPGDYTKSPYALMYYFELHDGNGQAWLEPGLNADLANQPYFLVRPVR
ncbi:MAG: twin-arginine translocation signal domain-containing protein [Verrucomicrobia bacterium]|nr:twin-arginine translocation signal domain-containing protein [Verrucomicrobiota bacterium]